MERIKSLLANALFALIVLASLGFGMMVVGLAIVLGGAFALALQLAGPGLTAEASVRADEMQAGPREADPAAA